MKGLQRHPDRPDHIMVNLSEGGSMYIRPSILKEITLVDPRGNFVEVKYGQQRLRLRETRQSIQELIDATRKQ